MRPSLLLLLASSLSCCLALGCANGGRVTSARDAHVAGPDGGRDAAPSDAAIIDGSRIDANVVQPDAAVPDMGVVANDAAPAPQDAFAIDVGSVPTDTGCTSAAACSDGITCNGVERCEAGRCVSGTPVTCDDGLACTTDACVEPGTCQYTSTCAGGAACGATGCATACSESPCRLLAPQCGCPSGQGCYPSGATRACAPAGVGAAGAGCTTAASCAPGNVCQDVSTRGTAVNVCSRVCTVDSDCGGGLCVVALDDGTGHPVSDLHLCSHVCNAVTQSGCPSGTECGLLLESTGAMRPFTECTAPIGTGATDTPCATDEDCRAGFICIDGDDGFGVTCHRLCAYPSSTVCPSFQSCLDFVDPVVINGTEYGVCD